MQGPRAFYFCEATGAIRVSSVAGQGPEGDRQTEKAIAALRGEGGVTTEWHGPVTTELQGKPRPQTLLCNTYKLSMQYDVSLSLPASTS
ncbi:hypothetical protein N9L68_03125 [bacterium]|nr:hypothetical protein [bacterium]